jgi:hypothetical protein
LGLEENCLFGGLNVSRKPSACFSFLFGRFTNKDPPQIQEITPENGEKLAPTLRSSSDYGIKLAKYHRHEKLHLFQLSFFSFLFFITFSFFVLAFAFGRT